MDARSLEARALDLVEQAFDQPSALRAQWLRTAAADDPALLARALEILGHEAEAARVLRTGGAVEAVPEPLPERVGAYRILALLGQGGMGAVYLGHREAGDFDHRAAIKVVRPGALSEVLVERFQRERQTLAALNHPHIARLLDGGQTADGAPYIVMEYVEGRPLLDDCADRALATPRRLALFLDACAAVGYAHQNQVLHRDITPSNVLVTGDGVVKLIDFGIAGDARDTAADAAARPARTLERGSFTPGYAPPERLRGHPGNTLSDVYGLGRLLEDLLRCQDPPPDLAAIAERATREEPEQRYATVAALMADVQRYLEGRPVEAYRGGRRYAWRKLARRHRGTFAAAGAAVLLLCAAVVGTSFGMWRAERAQARAERERDLARAANRFIDRMLAGPSPQESGRDVRMVDFLRDAARDLRESVDLPVPVRAALHLTLGKTFKELGRAEEARAELEASIALCSPAERVADTAEVEIEARGVLCELLADLGETREAAAQAAAVERAVANMPDAPAWVRLRPLELRATLAGEEDDPRREVELLRAVLARWSEVAPAGSDEVESARNNLAVALLRADQLPEAEDELRTSLAARRAAFGAEHPKTLVSESNLAQTLADAGRVGEALELQRELAPAARRVWGDDHPMTLVVRNNLASTLMELGRLDEAYELYVDVRDRVVARYGPRHEETLLARNNLAVCAMRLEHFAVALEELREVLAILESLPEPDHTQHGLVLGNLASALTGLHREEEALDYSARSLDELQETLGEAHVQTLIRRNNHALLLLSTGASDDAVTCARRNLDLAEQRAPGHPYNQFPFRMNLGRALAGAGRYAEAERELSTVQRALETDPDALESARARVAEVLKELYAAWPEGAQ